jgi:hypothetical protein
MYILPSEKSGAYQLSQIQRANCFVKANKFLKSNKLSLAMLQCFLLHWSFISWK